MSTRTRVTKDFDWNGDEVERRFNRATARGTVAIGQGVSTEAKKLVHVQSGDLRRSIHVAQARNVEGEPSIDGRSFARAAHASGATVEVGSWLAYACVEETGRQHVYMGPAVEIARSFSKITMAAAFRAEGFE